MSTMYGILPTHFFLESKMFCLVITKLKIRAYSVELCYGLKLLMLALRFHIFACRHLVNKLYHLNR